MIAKEGVKFEIKDAFLRAKVAQGNLQRARNAEKTARQILFLAQSNYDIGVGEQRELVDALQLVLLTRGRYFEAVFDYNIALAQLDEKIGVIPEVKK
jgi:outer membrane protein TolC